MTDRPWLEHDHTALGCGACGRALLDRHRWHAGDCPAGELQDAGLDPRDAPCDCGRARRSPTEAELAAEVGQEPWEDPWGDG